MQRRRKTFVVIGALIGVAAALYTLSLDRPTPPTELASRPELSGPLALPIGPRTLVDPPRSPGRAGAIYRGLAADYHSRTQSYERVARDRERGSIPTIRPQLDELILAATMPTDAIFSDVSTDEIVRYGDPPSVEALRRVGQAAVLAAMLEERQDAGRATRLYEATFALGLRLFEERLTWRELFAGIELMSTAGAARAEQLERAGDSAAAMRWRDFLESQRDVVRDRWTPIFEAIDTRRPELIGRHNGDVVAIATNPAADRMFRTEAILKLGRLRFNIGTPARPANERRVERTLESLDAGTPEPAVRQAIELAKRLSVEGFRSLR